MNPPRRWLGNTDDPAIPGDDYFGFDGMAFLLAGIPATLFSAWPLNRLFRAVDDQGLGLLAADPDRALDPQNPHCQGLDPSQGPADGRFVGSV